MTVPLQFPTEHRPHPAAELFPLMTDEELQELAADIRANGLLEPVLLLDGAVLDGRNRMAACALAGVSPYFTQAKNIESPTTYVVSKNLHRRHLTISQRAAIAARMVPMLAEEARERQRDAGGDKKSADAKSLRATLPEAISTGNLRHINARSRDIAGQSVGVGGRTVDKAVLVMKEDPEAFAQVQRGETTVEEAARKVRDAMPPKGKRQCIIENAAKQRMANGLSQVGGLARGLSELDIETLRKACSPEDIKLWAGVALKASRELRALASALRREEINETPVN